MSEQKQGKDQFSILYKNKLSGGQISGGQKKTAPPRRVFRSAAEEIASGKVLIFSIAVLFIIWFALIHIKISHTRLEDQVRQLNVVHWDEQSSMIPLIVLKEKLTGLKPVEEYATRELNMVYPKEGEIKKIIVLTGEED